MTQLYTYTYYKNYVSWEKNAALSALLPYDL